MEIKELTLKEVFKLLKPSTRILVVALSMEFAILLIEIVIILVELSLIKA